jgi:plastocyanin
VVVTRHFRAGIVVAVVMAGAWLWSMPAIAAAAAKPATHTIAIDGTRYQIDTLTVKAGDTVVWVNKDLLAHTVTSKTGGFDSQTILPGKSWKYVAKKKGEFAYTCTFHPTMKGTLKVQ